MNSPRSTIIAATLCVLLTSFRLVAAQEHPQMHDASEALHAAQSSAHPIEDLEKAKQRLQQAKQNKAGFRAEAIQLTDKAIAALKAGNRVDANKAITEAINLIEKGIALHPGDGKKK